MNHSFLARATIRPAHLEKILDGHAEVSLQRVTHPFMLANAVAECASEGYDVIRVQRKNRDLPPVSHWTANYALDAGGHDGLTAESASRIQGLELILPECSREGLGDVVLALTRGNTLYAAEVLCIKARDVKERREDTYLVFINHDL